MEGMMKTEKILLALFLFYFVINTNAQDFREIQNSNRLIMGTGFSVEVLSVLPFRSCNLVNVVELMLGRRKTLTDAGILGISTVEFICMQQNGIVVRDDSIAGLMNGTYALAFDFAGDPKLRSGQRIRIYYQVQKLQNDHLDLNIAAIEKI